GHDDLIGTICLWNFSEDKTQAELGYELKPVFQGLGLMDEAVKSVLVYSFESIGIQTLCAFTHHNNNASRRLLEKNGFEFDPDQKDDGNVNNVVYLLNLPLT
ncbi:MAG: GNAT family N-acetyltransferase; N-acetyltransferase, partial [Saprospiraceae bacterium]